MEYAWLESYLTGLLCLAMDGASTAGWTISIRRTGDAPIVTIEPPPDAQPPVFDLLKFMAAFDPLRELAYQSDFSGGPGVLQFEGDIRGHDVIVQIPMRFDRREGPGGLPRGE